MRLLFTADWHIGVTNFGVVDSNGRNSRSLDVAKAIDRAIEIGIEEKIDLFICGGDIFHVNRPSIEDQIIFYHVLEKLRVAPFKSRFIIGNHDYTSRLGANHALKLFMRFLDMNDKIKIFDQTTSEEFDLLNIYFYPYGSTPPDINPIRCDRIKSLLVCHSHLEGAVVGAEPFEIKSDRATNFRDLNVDYVLAGHFHKPQILSEKKPLALYPGSLVPVDFNERLDNKGVVILDTHSGEYSWIETPTRKFVQIDIDFNSSEVITNDLKDMIVKINIKLDESELGYFDESALRKQLEEAGVHSIASINLIVDRKEVKRNKSINLAVDLKKNFLEYYSMNNYGIHSELVRKLGMEIINACSGV